MGVNSLPSAWRSNIRTGQVQTRDLRLYLDPRGVEYPDLETGAAVYTLAREDNLIDRGNCESATAPMMFGETVPVLINATFAQSTDFAHGGDSSFKVTKTIAAGTDARVTICDSAASGDMHGFVAGETYDFSKWVYIPTASGILGTEIAYVVYKKTAAGGFVATTIATATNTYDAWQKLSGSFTLADNIIGCFLRIFVASAAALNEYFYVDDFRLSSHTVPGSHYLSSGYVETLCPMTETFTLQVAFIPRFAYNTGSNQPLCSWYVSATQFFYIYYAQSPDKFAVGWYDGTAARYLTSAQYDNGTTFRNIGQKIILTAAIDLSTGTTAGSALWMDKTQDDIAWDGNIDAKTTEFNKMQFRAYNGTAGAFDILWARLIPNFVATNAQVQNDFKDVANEEIFWSFDGHGTGRTRCNISRFFINYNIYKGVTSKVSDSHGTNILGITLKSLQGEFADDQYGSYSPSSYQYNGTAAQAYLSRRMGVSLESWYSGDFEHVFVGRLTEQGLQRASYNHNQSYVSGTVEDGVGDIDRTFETNGRVYITYDICDPANEGDSLIHTIAHLADRNNKQYLANNSFEEATIGDSWLVTAGGALNKDAADGYFGTCSGELIPGAAAEQAYQTVTFTGKDKLNVGAVLTFWCWVKSTAAAAGANNYIQIDEEDSVGSNDSTQQVYTLAGGEHYKLVSVTHTVTDATSDRIKVSISGAAGDTINIDGCMLVRCNYALNYFAVNTNDGASGVESADDAVGISWPWFGVDADAVNYEHPWRRVEAGTSIWENLKSLANASGPKYLGMSECNTLTLKAVLQTDYSDDVPIDELTGAKQNIGATLDEMAANKLIGHGVKIVLANEDRLIWLASSTGNFSDPDGDNVLNESVADNGYWPAPATYPEYWAQFGAAGDRRLQSNLTLWPSGLTRNGELYIQPGSYALVPNNPNSAESITRKWNAAWQTIPTSKRDKVIGVRDGDLIHKLATTSTDGQGAFTETIFDVNTKAGQAHILLMNETGGADTVRECAIVGKPVYLYEGEEGYTNDGHIDWPDIQENGERLLEFGGSDVIDGSVDGQLDKLADYLWKDRGKRKHVYSLMFDGECHDISPADVYLLAYGAAGETEYITSRAEVMSVNIERRAGTFGLTHVVLRELEEAWKYDSNVYSRFVARGVLVQSPSGGSTITVGSEYCTVPTDFRVAIGNTSAEDVINAAIDFVNGAFGGGIVHLTRGTYKTDGKIVLKAGVILEGEGDSTVIEKNCNDYAVKGNGGAGTEIIGTGVRNLKLTRDAGDVNNIDLFYCQYCDNLLIDNLLCEDSYYGGAVFQYCDNLDVRGIKVINHLANYGISFTVCTGTASQLYIDGESTAQATGIYGLYTDSAITITGINIRNLTTSGAIHGIRLGVDDVNISNVIIENLTKTSGATAIVGIYLVDVNNCRITGATVIDVDNSNTAALAYGIHILQQVTTCDDNVLTGVQVIDGTGTGVVISANADRNILSGRSTNNGTNFTDGGTNTNTAAFDAT